jgi:hypothetical protein
MEYLKTRDARQLCRPNKTSRGLMETIHRRERSQSVHAGRMTLTLSSRGGLSDDARTLAVRGTLDRLACGLQFKTKLVPCACCGCKCRGKVHLTNLGRARLLKLRVQAKRRKGADNEA